MNILSFWAKVGVVITDLEGFKIACEKNDVEYRSYMGHSNSGTVATLQDRKGRSHALLIKDGANYRMKIDNDTGYSSLSKRLGRNGGKLMRDYTQGVVEKNISRSGGMISQRQEQPDGSVILKVAVGF